MCRDTNKSGPGLVTILGLAAAAAVVIAVVHVILVVIDAVMTVLPFLTVAIATGLGLLLIFRVARFVRLPRAAKRNYPAAIRARIRWRYITSNLGLARPDPHQTIVDRRAIGPHLTSAERIRKTRRKVRHLRARIRPTGHGIQITVKTIPGTGRPEFEQQAAHLANYWRCAAGVASPSRSRAGC